MPWLTPDEATLPRIKCLSVPVPAGEVGRACFLGALQPLSSAGNWEQYGTATPIQTAAAFLDALWDAGDCARLEYAARVLSTHHSDLIAFWPLSHSPVDLSGKARDGNAFETEWGAPGIGDGLTAAFFDSAPRWVDVSGASLAAAFDGNIGSLIVWFRVANAGVWTDGAWRRLLSLYVDANNVLEVYRRGTDGDVSVSHTGDGTTRTVTHTFADFPTGWQCLAATWDTAATELRLYVNGAASSAWTWTMGTWTGSLNQAFLGAQTNGGFRWFGSLAHVALWQRVLTAGEIEALGVG